MKSNTSEIHPLIQIVKKHKKGIPVGIYSVCSSNEWVLEAAMLHAKETQSLLLIESTCNQVNQFGGYSGRTPEKFASYVKEIADRVAFPMEHIVLGGDHLGPYVWQREPAEEAMDKSCQLVRSYVMAGASKIHLDTSMGCADDPDPAQGPVPEEVIAKRAAQLAKVAEAAWEERQEALPPPLYIIGTEVPVPGGAQGGEFECEVTTVESARRTIEITRQAFSRLQLDSAWERVIALVVQPGVEFSDFQVIAYDRDTARALSRDIESQHQLIYEAHSTDYQSRESLKQLVEDHFAILKVGPMLTFAFREALFALESIEREWRGGSKSIALSEVSNVLESEMLRNPDYWKSYYQGNERQLRFARRYSYSDRCRYYWTQPKLQKSIQQLISNLSHEKIPHPLLSQFFPHQLESICEGKMTSTPQSLILDKIKETLLLYSYACGISS